MNLRGPVSAVVTTLLAATVSLTAGAAAADPSISGTIEIPCAASILEQSAEWYLPAAEPVGLVWIQHGFARTNAHVSALATEFADAGYLVFAPSLPFMNLEGCTLQNLGDNSRFLHSVAAIFGTAADPRGALATSLAAAARRAGAPTPALPHDLVFIGHSAGAEAVTFVANRIRTEYPKTWNTLRGLVLLDPVRSFIGDNIDNALNGIDGTQLPVLTISAEPALCNSFGLGTLAVQSRLHRPFVGVRLPAGAHTDAEGSSSDLLGGLLCGFPTPANATTLHTLALGWSNDFRTGTTTPVYYPTASQRFITAAPTATVLTGS